MNGIEYLNELVRLRKAATLGPWKHNKWIIKSLEARKIAQTINLDNAAYIVAACNSVERLTDMLVFLASLASGGDESGDAIERRIQWAYDETRPKE